MWDELGNQEVDGIFQTSCVVAGVGQEKPLFGGAGDIIDILGIFMDVQVHFVLCFELVSDIDLKVLGLEEMA